MATSRRRDIANFLVGELKKIDGNASSFDSSYTYQILIDFVTKIF